MRELVKFLKKQVPGIVSVGIGERTDTLPRSWFDAILRRPAVVRKTSLLSLHVVGDDCGDPKSTIDAYCAANNVRIEWIVLPQFVHKKRR